MTRLSRLVLGWIAGLVLLFALSTVIAQAQPYTETTTLKWANPSQYVNGAPLPLSDIQNIAVLWASSPNPQAILGSQNMQLVAAPPQTFELQQPEGQRCFGLRTLATNGELSGLSNVACKTVVVDPEPPSDLLIWQPLTGPIYVSAEDNGAYAVTQANNRITPLWVGTFPPGTECDPTQGFNGMYLVPRELADLDLDDDGEDDTDAATVVARCVQD